MTTNNTVARDGVVTGGDGFTRRSMLKIGAGAAAVATAVSGAANAKAPATNGHPILAGNANLRSSQALQRRLDAARTSLQDFLGQQQTNGDEGLYADYRASYAKALPHTDDGLVDPEAYRALLKALESRSNADYEAIPVPGPRKLANPQGAYRFEMVGRDAHNTFMRPAPTFAGDETAAEMGEVYWKALCRDIPFDDFDSNPLIAAAVADLNAFTHKIGPNDTTVSTATVFRGETPGDLVGPYISQFLLKDIPFGNSTLEQRYATPAPGDDHMTTFASWLAVQRGGGTPPLVKGNARYINDARALGEYVHIDFSYQAYQSAALILLAMPGSFDMDNLYNTSATQGAFVTLGGPDVLDLVAKAGNLSLTGAWYQKWLVHRRLRPEVYGARLHRQKLGLDAAILPSDILNSDGVGRTFMEKGSYLLPMAFTEGSPTHPAYPAGHATIAGACCTVLKAFFQEDMPIASPVVSTPDGAALLPYGGGDLTIGGEINKLASNVALGRDWAGVHYRSDGVDGLLVGEQQAIGLLRDYSRTYNEQFNGFNLTTFGGQTIRIQNGNIL